MKKIMFNDKYGLTQAVLEGRKTMTRRVITIPETWHGIDVYGFCHVKGQASLELTDGDDFTIEDPRTGQCAQIMPTYRIGEEVAVAQNYEQAGWKPDTLQQAWVKKPTIFPDLDEYQPLCGWVDLPFKYHKGWTNKMFVLADLMPHRIRITNIKVERLQDISDADILREGIQEYTDEKGTWYQVENSHIVHYDIRQTFSELIDRVSGRGTWDSNPYVFAYEFELLNPET